MVIDLRVDELLWRPSADMVGGASMGHSSYFLELIEKLEGIKNDGTSIIC